MTANSRESELFARIENYIICLLPDPKTEVSEEEVWDVIVSVFDGDDWADYPRQIDRGAFFIRFLEQTVLNIV